MNPKSVVFAKEKLNSLMEADPEALVNLAKAVAPSIALLTGLFERFGLIDDETSKEDLKALYSGAVLTMIDMSLDNIVKYLETPRDKNSEAN